MAGVPGHVPVLLDEVLRWLQPRDSGLYVDATLGLGGHSRAILTASAPGGRVIGFEWDDQAAAMARKNLAAYGDRIQVVAASYVQLQAELSRLDIDGVDGLLADLGVSSLQLDKGERGFSFQVDAPLDMRMDRSRQVRAATLLAELSEAQLADLLYYYGEERQARRIARYLVQVRQREPIERTLQLAHLVAEAIPKKYHPRRVHVATKTFQALRIAVNGELDNIRALLATAPALLKPGGCMVIITFHSLEDRLVKQAFEQDDRLQLLLKKPLEPQAEEIRRNPRARSAKMRVAQRK
ncbi:MAG: 16S rRNA (cytosine(1402)-N(4))-methyltransferase RsmH [Desulfobulbus sp.]|jgi:16S rRNA (cytosine1402-N4)-methyltransferase|nr:16S rRNA (cytosine(1402)-N(4))-methyltransferase RsmH [Desulfobulbaceae bacterium]